MPGTTCSVSFCKNNHIQTRGDPSTSHIRYHTFPKDTKIRNQWLKYCRRAGSWNPSFCRICSEHFRPEDYERDMQAELLNLKRRSSLKPNAVPSVPPPLEILEKEALMRKKAKCNKKEKATLKKILSKGVKTKSSPVNSSPDSKKTKNESLKSQCSDVPVFSEIQTDQFSESHDITNKDVYIDNDSVRELMELRIENARLTEKCKELHASLVIEIQEKSTLLARLKRAQEDIEFKNQILFSQRKRLMILRRKKLKTVCTATSP